MNRRTAALLRPHGKAFVGALIAAGILAVCRGVLILGVAELFEALEARSLSTALWWSLGLGILFVAQGAARFGRGWLTRQAAIRAERDLRNRLFDCYLRTKPDRLRRSGYGEALSVLSHDVGTVRTAVGAAVTLVQRPLTALSLAAAAAAVAPRLSFFALILLPPVVVVVRWSSRETRASAERRLAALGELEAQAKDSVHGLKTIQAQGAELQVKQGYEKANELQVYEALRAARYRLLGPPLVEISAALALVAIVAIGASQISRGLLEPGELVGFLLAIALLNEPLKGVATAHALWSEAKAGMSRVFSALDLFGDTTESIASAGVEASLPDGPLELCLADVVVDRGRGPVLKNLDLSVGPGDRIVIQGISGSGKTTLLDLIAGFVELSSGRILWNQEPSENWALASRRRRCAFVEQEPWLGRGTLLEAIALGDPDPDPERALRAVAAAGLCLEQGLLSRLPGGLAARIGDGGEALSVGEGRRVSLARALYRGASLLLLDEPTAGLDSSAERTFLQTLAGLPPETSIVLVSHRSAPITLATRAYELVSGGLRPLLLAKGDSGDLKATESQGWSRGLEPERSGLEQWPRP